MDGVDLAVVVGGAVLTVVVLAILLWQWFPRPMSTDPPPNNEPAAGPTDAPYPPGSRPGGPAAEGMAVGHDGGDIFPSPPDHAETGVDPDRS
ncbi:MAG: hypothetical protein R2761_18780 [Acidimicrobiales bacterium]